MHCLQRGINKVHWDLLDCGKVWEASARALGRRQHLSWVSRISFQRDMMVEGRLAFLADRGRPRVSQERHSHSGPCKCRVGI